jgi:EAL domain-containing protein (putative c-di-GMP-specific phosphodiesterase class I)/DNA-binding NarL/FixJ family response regulator
MSDMAGVPVRVLIADDQDFLAAGRVAALDSLGEFELVGVAGSPLEAGGLAALTQPDVALVDVGLQGGAEAALDEILSASPATRVLACSGVSDDEAVTGMLRAGASGTVGRDAPAEKLADALRGVPRGVPPEREVNGHGLLHELLDQVRETNLLREERERKRGRILSVMEHGGLEIAFQPIVDLDSRAVVGHEALSRFAPSPRRGPEQWFAEAHDVGLGVELELFAIRMGCERSRVLPKDTFMAVNVSPVTAERADLLELLDCAHVDHVVLEVTEHAPVEDYPRFRVAISRMREHGAKLAIDDAGAGFASLRHILELNAELIKLDGSLTHSLEADPRRRSGARAGRPSWRSTSSRSSSSANCAASE